MIGKVIFTIATLLVAMLILRQFSSKKPARQKAKIRQKPGNAGKAEQLVWDEESGSYRVKR